MNSVQPSTFYRYRAFNELTLDSLCNDELYFSSPSAFNDPLDCQPRLVSNSSNYDLRRVLSHLIINRVTAETIASLTSVQANKEQATKYANGRAQQTAEQKLQDLAYHATNPDYEVSQGEAENWLLLTEIQRELIQQNDKGICCFSAEVDNPLMWSHYADQHKGIVIGYNLERNPKPELNKIEYGGDRTLQTNVVVKALLDNDVTAQEVLNTKALLQKAQLWEYENEWRLFGNQGIQDSPLKMTEITFGMKCNSSVIYTVLKALEGREDDINFFQIREDRGSFHLKREPLDYGELCAYYPKTARSGIEIFGHLDVPKVTQNQ